MKATLILHERHSIECIKNFDSLLDIFELTICVICGNETKSYWDPRYKGRRASCIHCGINWAES